MENSQSYNDCIISRLRPTETLMLCVKTAQKMSPINQCKDIKLCKKRGWPYKKDHKKQPHSDDTPIRMQGCVCFLLVSMCPGSWELFIPYYSIILWVNFKAYSDCARKYSAHLLLWAISKNMHLIWYIHVSGAGFDSMN